MRSARHPTALLPSGSREPPPCDGWAAHWRLPLLKCPAFMVGLSLYTDAAGHVAGPQGFSGETSTAVYQELVLPGWFANQKSGDITVEATP
jgi:hypothetical protein